MGWAAGGREDHGRPGRVRWGPSAAGRARAAGPRGAAPLWAVPAALSGLWPGAGSTTLAGAGPGRCGGGAGGWCAAGALRRARGGGGGGALGAARRRAHPVLRWSGCVAGGGLLEDCGDRVDADRLAHRRGDRHPGRPGRDGRAEPVRRVAPDRDRWDQLQLCGWSCQGFPLDFFDGSW